MAAVKKYCKNSDLSHSSPLVKTCVFGIETVLLSTHKICLAERIIFYTHSYRNSLKGLIFDKWRICCQISTSACVDQEGGRGPERPLVHHAVIQWPAS